MKSGIYVVATPIGNLNDISSRALEVLQNADVIACEDTRVTKKLFSLLGLGLKKTFVTLHDHNEEEQAQKLIDMVNRGQSIAQVSDAGCPLISDPGYKLIKRCREQGVAVTTIPGPCALICALQLSGLPTNSFMFAGFIPNKDTRKVWRQVCVITPKRASTKIMARLAVEPPVIILRVYCSCPGVSAIINLRLFVEK